MHHDSPTSPQERLAALAGRDPELSTGPVQHPEASPEDEVRPHSAQTQAVAAAGPDPTHALPTTPQRLDAAAMRASARSRSFLLRMVQGEAPPTQAMDIVERLAGSPYARPAARLPAPETSTIGTYEGARKTLDLSLQLAEVMFRYGAGALEVETSIIAVTAAYGLKDVDVDITNQSVQLNYSPQGQTPMTVLRVVRSWTNNYAGLVLVHELVTRIVEGGVSRSDASLQLRAITRRPKPFPKWMVTLSGALFCGAIVLLIGGHWPESLVTALSIIVAGLTTRKLGQWRVPDFYSTAVSAFVVTAFAMGMYWIFGDRFSPVVAVAGGLVLMLPAGRTVGSVQDAINGFPVTAAGRLLSAMLTFGAIVVGIAVAVSVATISGVGKLDVTQQALPDLPFWATAIVVFVAGMLIVVYEQSQVRLLIPTAVVAVSGFVAYVFFQHIGFGPRLTPALAATVVGFFGRIFALRMGAPQLVIAVPAVLYLLPGLAIFRAMYTLTIEDSAFQGVAGLASAFMVILGLAAGTVAGDNLARPFTRSTEGSVARRRGRRR
ncbi:threonine/serine ThrE exporter family protein [Arthrobacter sp. UM1]|uniref:threonine/serine ThrE exporter family protein n=1 Tax=Arthrobacter sp. UM1 TaxID=2766776 RepID=UPI001CF623AE|nr:threonine/serine exporter family protein [Arthrobacter sp. UM1]